MNKKKPSRGRSAKRHSRTLKQRRRSRKAGPGRRQHSRRMLQTVSLGADDPDHDNCPYCTAMRELGIVDGEPISSEQHEAYKARVDELIAQGMPAGERMTGEDIMASYDWINARLRERGQYVESMEELSDERLAEHMERVLELSAEYERLN